MAMGSADNHQNRPSTAGTVGHGKNIPFAGGLADFFNPSFLHAFQILDNFVGLAKEPGIRIILRVPLVPGITATNENLKQIASFLESTGCSVYELLPYNPGGIAKRIAIGRDVPPEIPRSMMGIEEEERWKKKMKGFV